MHKEYAFFQNYVCCIWSRKLHCIWDYCCVIILSLGLIGVQTTVQAMVEVMWGFMEASTANVTIVLPHLVEMLLSQVISWLYVHVCMCFVCVSLSIRICLSVC